MATVINNARDFILFSHRPDAVFDSPASFVDGDFAGLSLDMDAQYHAGQAGLAAPTFDAFPIKDEQRSADFYFDSMNHVGALDASADFPVPMSSTSPSVSQSLEQSSATYSLPSGASAQSATSSTIGSPYSQHTPSLPAAQEQFLDGSNGLGIGPSMNGAAGGADAFAGAFDSFLGAPVVDDQSRSTFGVDPHLLHQPMEAAAAPMATGSPYSGIMHPQSLQRAAFPPPSPAPSDISHHESHRTILGRSTGSRHPSPGYHSGYSPYPGARRDSMASGGSHGSYSPRSNTGTFEDGDAGNKDNRRCPYADCGRVVRDLKAHMLTHQSERPEKCPIVTCEYHIKGFARKYDRCRHTLTHYKGTMVCDFCPNSGSAAEKSFNRADVFKRHLTSVHGVEQSPPNSRKKPAAPQPAGGKERETGKCSTCGSVFPTPQDFYDHLDDCVLKSLEQAEPSEDINAKHLGTIANDRGVQETLDKHHLVAPDNSVTVGKSEDEEDEHDEDEEEVEEADEDVGAASGRAGSKPTRRDPS